LIEPVNGDAGLQNRIGRFRAMKCDGCESTIKVQQRDWNKFLCESCYEKYSERDSRVVTLALKHGPVSADAYYRGKSTWPNYLISNILFFPFRLGWNIIVTALIITAFVFWFGFIFGSVIAVVLILIFAPDLFLLPLGLAVLYTKMWY
jgi:hypothetical protein